MIPAAGWGSRPARRRLASRSTRRISGPVAPANDRVACDCECAAVPETDRLWVALLAARSARPLHRALLLREMDGRRDLGSGPAGAAGREPPPSGPGAPANGGNHGPSDGQARGRDGRGGVGWREVTDRPP